MIELPTPETDALFCRNGYPIEVDSSKAMLRARKKTMSDTPETDKAERMAYAQEHMVPTEVARKLERERNKAREEIKNLKLQLGLWEEGNLSCEETLGEIRLLEEQIKQALIERDKAYKIAEQAIDDLAWFNDTNAKRLGNELKKLKEETK